MKVKVHLKKVFLTPLWDQNQVLVAILGICSALAVTTNVKIALTMGVSVIIVTTLSSFLVSLIKHLIPDSLRLIAQLIIISTLVIIIEQFLGAYFYNIYKKLSIFVGLIITNCIVLGRTEAIARKNSPIPAAIDGFSAGLGYTIVLFIIGSIREVLGFGSFFGKCFIEKNCYPELNSWGKYSNFDLMTLAPGAFFLLGFLIWIFNSIKNKEKL